MLLFANPYFQLDHRDRLAGACPMPEPVRPAGPTPPLRRHVGASLEMTAGSYVPENPAAGLDAQADTFWLFSPDPVLAEGHEHFWQHRLTAPAEAIASLDGSEDPPIAELAAERLACIDRHVASYGSEPDTSTWAAQFAIDPIVAVAMHELADKRAAEPVAAPVAPVPDPRAIARKAAIDAANTSLAQRVANHPPPQPAAPAPAVSEADQSERRRAASRIKSEG